MGTLRLLPLLALGSCSLGTFDYVECTDNAACRDAFGWGWTCGAEGLCEMTSPPTRCGASWPADFWNDPAAYRDAVVLGVDYDHTLTSEINAMRLVISQVNEAQGLDGKSYVILQCDNAENATYDSLSHDDAAAEVGAWLSQDMGVPAIIGCDTSGASEATFQAIEPEGTMMMSPSATSPALTDIDGIGSTEEAPGLFWRAVPPDSLQGEVIADQLKSELGVTRAAVIYESGPYGEGLQEIFYSAFVDGTHTADLHLFSSSSEQAAAVAAVGSSDVQEVLFIASGQQEIIDFLQAAKGIAAFTRDEDPIGIFLTDAAAYGDIFTEVNSPDLFANVMGTRLAFTPGVIFDTFKAAYAAAYNGADVSGDAYAAYAYDATWLTIYASVWSHYQEPSIWGMGMARGMRHVSAGNTLSLQGTDWNTLKSSFETGTSVNVQGTSGSLDYDPATGETSSPVDVWGVQSDGLGGWEIVVLETVSPS